MDVWKHDQAIKKLEEDLKKFSKDIDNLSKAVKNIETFIQTATENTKKKMVVTAMDNIAKKKSKKKGKKDVLQYD